MTNIWNPMEAFLEQPSMPDVPVFRWAVVVDWDNFDLHLLIDGDSEPIIMNNPDLLIQAPKPGDRLFIVRHRKRIVILGSANGGSDYPIGALIPYTGPVGVGATLPLGLILPDGRQLSRVTYSQYFDLVGTTYGAGNGTTTFNAPNLLGKTPVCYNPSETEFNTIGKVGGSKTHTLTAAQIPALSGTAASAGGHTHGIASPGRFMITDRTSQFSNREAPSALASVAGVPALAPSGIVTSVTATATGGAHTHTVSVNPGATAEHPILNPYMAIPFLLKVI